MNTQRFNRISSINHIVIIFTITLCCSALAYGQGTAQRTFVSVAGNDQSTASLCGVTTPCRSFSAAQTVTTAGGEIVVLASGGYGAINITKALSIIAPAGVYGGITQSGAGSAITVNAGSTDTVILKGLTLNGLNGANSGINFNSGAALHVEGCTISNFGSGGNDAGIQFDAPGQLFVNDTTLRDGYTGILLFGNVGQIIASIDHCRTERFAQFGVVADFNVQASVRDSVSTSNGVGFQARSGAKMTVSNSAATDNQFQGFNVSDFGDMSVESCVAKGNGDYGMGSTNNGVIRVSNSVSIGNAIGFKRFNSSTFKTRGNNTVRGNTTDVSNTLTILNGQ